MDGEDNPEIASVVSSRQLFKSQVVIALSVKQKRWWLRLPRNLGSWCHIALKINRSQYLESTLIEYE